MQDGTWKEIVKGEKKERKRKRRRKRKRQGQKRKGNTCVWFNPPTSRMSRVVMSEVAVPSWLAASTQISYGVKRARLRGMWQEYRCFPVTSSSHSLSVPYHLDRNTATKITSDVRLWKHRMIIFNCFHTRHDTLQPLSWARVSDD